MITFTRNGDYLKALLGVLLEIKAGIGLELDCGICYHVDIKFRWKFVYLAKANSDNLEYAQENIQHILKIIYKEWPKYSGNPMYPVPAPEYLTHLSPMLAKEAYCYSSNHWVGAYGQLRMELLDFMIDVLKAR